MNTDGEDRTELLTPSSAGTTEQESHSKPCGHLEIALLYDAPMRKMTVHVLQARNIQCRDRSQPTHTQVSFLCTSIKFLNVFYISNYSI